MILLTACSPLPAFVRVLGDLLAYFLRMHQPAMASSVSQSLEEAPPPDPLPQGWILRHSRSQPGTVYFYNQETGESTWEQPAAFVLMEETSESVQVATCGSE